MSGVPDTRMDTGKMLELRLKGLSYADIGAIGGGLAAQTVHQRLSKFTKLMDNPDQVTAFRAHEAELLDAVRTSLITSLADDLAVKKGKNKLSGYQKVGMYGILFDKMRLLRGESTANVHSLTAIIQAALGQPVKQSEDAPNSQANPIIEVESKPENE